VQESADWLLDMQASVDPDLIHLNTFCHGNLPWTAPVLMVAHSCVLSWWESVKQEPLPREWDRYRHEVERGLRAADAIVAPTRAMGASIERLYGVPSVRTIPNGRDASRGFVPGDKQPLILAAGRLWDEAKNLAALDRACAGLTWPLYVAGEVCGPSEQIFEPQSGIALGNLSPIELAAWMRQATIYALPARYEPFGLSVLEAALCGCALVLGDIPSLRENWDDAALFVPPGDEAALRGALESLIESPAVLDHFGKRALQRGSEFTRDRMVANYLQAYAKLLDAVPVPPPGVAVRA
jgi:glycogen synthase